jgi:hypothetical protein
MKFHSLVSTVYQVKWQLSNLLTSEYSLFFNQIHDMLIEVCKYKILLNSGNLMISIGYTSQRLLFLMSLKVRKLAAKI